jgi:hypothetical protein
MLRQHVQLPLTIASVALMLGLVSARALETFVPQQPNLPMSVCETLTAERLKFGPTITSAEQYSQILNRTAWKHRGEGFGLSTKKNGNNCPSPGPETGVPVACDVLHRQQDNLIWDVLGASDVGGPGSVQCGPSLGPMTDSSRPWARPSNPGDDPKPPVDPPLPSCSLCQAELATAQQAVSSLNETLRVRDAELAATRRSLDDANEKLKHIPTSCEVDCNWLGRRLNLCGSCRLK